MPDVGDFCGAWSRRLLVEADGRRDATSLVTWLQGPSLFVDLRQPAAPPAVRVACLRDLDRPAIAALAEQEGFAGTFLDRADHFEWVRLIDYQPRSAQADRGTLTTPAADIVIEEGYERPYTEHWQREAGAREPASALRLRADGRDAILVRVGARFMFARGRAVPLAPLGHLRDRVRAERSLAAAQDLVDCEISLGSAVDEWRITRSTMPWRVGAHLAPHASGTTLGTADRDPDGRDVDRTWTIVEAEGARDRLWCFAEPLCDGGDGG